MKIGGRLLRSVAIASAVLLTGCGHVDSKADRLDASSSAVGQEATRGNVSLNWEVNEAEIGVVGTIVRLSAERYNSKDGMPWSLADKTPAAATSPRIVQVVTVRVETVIFDKAVSAPDHPATGKDLDILFLVEMPNTPFTRAEVGPVPAVGSRVGLLLVSGDEIYSDGTRTPVLSPLLASSGIWVEAVDGVATNPDRTKDASSLDDWASQVRTEQQRGFTPEATPPSDTSVPSTGTPQPSTVTPSVPDASHDLLKGSLVGDTTQFDVRAVLDHDGTVEIALEAVLSPGSVAQQPAFGATIALADLGKMYLVPGTLVIDGVSHKLVIAFAQNGAELRTSGAVIATSTTSGTVKGLNYAISVYETKGSGQLQLVDAATGEVTRTAEVGS